MTATTELSPLALETLNAIASGEPLPAKANSRTIGALARRGLVIQIDGKPVASSVGLQVAEPPASSTEGKRKGKRTPQECRCGCGEMTGGGNYRPGHDARHVGQVARAVVAKEISLAEGMDQLGSQALQLKAQAQIVRLTPAA
ncbi:hypothetical protein [Jongsikchunia kroppenstedtii]|uniref:hypothetical protein n=1 Tax=Jongsikchunia kroppenstedtii TaxID=1121721 RepID=UPI000365B5DA|nr:hypothetical protein [Jongsikchunia kroppenstedtii]